MSNQSNESGVMPVGNRLVVYPVPAERTTASGIVIPDPLAEREDLAQVEAEVVAIGGECWQKSVQPWCKVGDHVVIGKYTGIVRAGKDGKSYRIINDRDVIGVCHD